jgi:serine/threonine-protein kinase SRPK3
MSSSESQYTDQEDEEEDAKDYKRGGYHPVLINDYYNDRYRIIQKLGWGHFSTVWLAQDEQLNHKVALKIVKSAKQYTETAMDEIKLLQKVVSASDNPNKAFVVTLYDNFMLCGPHGNRFCS